MDVANLIAGQGAGKVGQVCLCPTGVFGNLPSLPHEDLTGRGQMGRKMVPTTYLSYGIQHGDMPTVAVGTACASQRYLS